MSGVAELGSFPSRSVLLRTGAALNNITFMTGTAGVFYAIWCGWRLRHGSLDMRICTVAHL